MSRTTKVALVLAALVSFIALYDAVTHGLTGHWSEFSTEPGDRVAWVAHLGSVIHGAGYRSFVAVLWKYRGSIDAGRRSRSVLRTIMVAAYAAIVPVGVASTIVGTDGAAGALGTALFLPMLLVPPALGITMLVQGDRRPGAWLMAGSIPAVGAVALLAWLAPDWAHPGYVETVVNFGIALLGVGAVSSAVADREAFIVVSSPSPIAG
ncbi:MAG: hypothetical protein Q4P07_07395 [Ornithinimicrobium sp.]|uniref:hypothetical protein n=1 Tax=Ornithinimicrobium sp. TaxID=1977084 RepID=UPI0026E07303|nr:hypothetical protein [Ornithinimicrobium sp.]MDO5739958.1 hypothetical protein [Ornithinimicrobium sp.]